MSEFWKQCEGQVVDNRFRLRQYLGGTDESAVFVTQLTDEQKQKAAIKFVPAGPAAEQQLSLWRRVKQLSHPNLLKVFEVGRCRLENRDRLYMVMESAEEDLSQILPSRPLSDSEAREMLPPAIEALTYLHSNGFVHSRVKPSNILATADQLKLSSDAISPIGEARKASRKFDVHDAPETATSPLTAAADVWSLGMTLVETLTQQTPSMQPGSLADPAVPETIPQPFLDIARHALRTDPRRRWTIHEIGARLNPAAVAMAAAAAQSVSPVNVPLSPVPAMPAAKLQAPRLDTPPPKPKPLPEYQQSAASAPRETFVLPNYVVPVAAGLFVLVAIIALPKILGHRAESSSSASTTSSAPAVAETKTADAPARHETPTKTPAKPAPQNSLSAVAEKKVVAPAASEAKPAPVRTDTFPSANAPAGSSSASARGEVLEQVVPNVSQKALDTIHGSVRVGVRVQVDPTGNVSDATLDSAGPSKFFADLALQAARRWQFNSPEVSGHSVPSTWVIRFQFTPNGSKATPTQVAP
jgi:TonB family protein